MESDLYWRLFRKAKKEEASLFSRLKSIEYDGEYVDEMTRYLSVNAIANAIADVCETERYLSGFPVLANLRCGLWYLQRYDNTCYFKSADGHAGLCNFSYTRLNLHVAQCAAEKGGVVIVDSTRKGKTYPDRCVRAWM
jgi:tRNA A64-2'-O-ribosylphosphate transferase